MGATICCWTKCRKSTGWEKAVNSLLENADTDIYVTGSNSKLMSRRDLHLFDGAVYLHPGLILCPLPNIWISRKQIPVPQRSC